MRKHNLFFICFIITIHLQAGVLSSITKASAKVGKITKSTKLTTSSMKLLSITESANFIFSQFKKNKNDIGLYIREDLHGFIYIKSSTGKNFSYQLKTEKTTLDNFILNIQKEILSKNQTKSNIDIYLDIEFYLKFKKYLNNNDFRLTLLNDFYPLNTKLIKTDRAYIRGVELEKNLYFDIRSIDDIENIQWILNKAYSPYNTRVISFFDELDVSTINKISSVSGELHISAKEVSKYGIDKTMNKLKGKTVFIIAHIENNFLVIRHPNGTIVQKISIQKLNMLSKSNHISMIILGCKSAKKYGTSGYLHNVQDLKVVKDLEKGLSSMNYSELLLSFTSVKNPLFLSYHTIDNMTSEINLLKCQQFKLSAESYMLSYLTMTTTSKAYDKERNSRLIWFIPSYVHIGYYILYILFVVFGGFSFFKSGWIKIKSLWIVSECSGWQHIKCFSEHIFRILVYFIFLPLIIVFFKPIRYTLFMIKNKRV